MYTYSKVGNTETLSNKIQGEIEKSIIQKKFIPGDKLPTEKEMCEMFGVSRTALREGLQMLSIQGLITIRKGSGIYVNEYNLSHAIKPISRYLEINLNDALIQQIAEVRQMFQPHIAGLAARNRDMEDVHLMEKNLAELTKSDHTDLARLSVIDQNLHLRICEAAKNPIISLQMDPILRLLPHIRSIQNRAVGSAFSELMEFHKQINRAIRDQDADRAREVMSNYLA